MPDSRRRRFQVLVVAAVTLCAPLRSAADLAVTCGARFIVFDKLVAGGRTLNVVPLAEAGNLGIAGTVPMPYDQRHDWAVYEDHVVVRTWNEVYVYQVDEAFQPRMISALQIDDSRPNVGGTTAIALEESVLRVYGTQRTLEIDLAECSTDCRAATLPAMDPPEDPSRYRPCSTTTASFLFSEVIASSGNIQGIIYHDVFLTRRPREPVRSEVDASLYLGTFTESID